MRAVGLGRTSRLGPTSRPCLTTNQSVARAGASQDSIVLINTRALAAGLDLV
jgi:hypothetical protein